MRCQGDARAAVEMRWDADLGEYCFHNRSPRTVALILRAWEEEVHIRLEPGATQSIGLRGFEYPYSAYFLESPAKPRE